MKKRTNSAFTLIELLVTIAMLMALVGMLLPAVGSMMRQAKRKAAAAEAKAITLSIKRFRTSYKKWPGQEQGEIDTTYDLPGDASRSPSIVLYALTNETHNTREISLIDIPEDVIVDGCYSDPWGQPYVITIDENGDGTSQVFVASESFETNVKDSVAVMSWGPDRKDQEFWVYSWGQ